MTMLISSDAEKKPEQVAKYTVKDSVFTSRFREPKYLLQLYQAPHPEDREATKDSITNVTITNVLLDQFYNDVGFQIREKLVILVEQQSSWSLNIVVRCPVPCPDIPRVFYGHEAEYIWEQKAETAEAGGLCYIYGQPKDKAGISESVEGIFRWGCQRP